LLGKANDAIGRLGERAKIPPECAAALSAMLTDGQRRASDLASTF
jgi:hypothetical protein